MKKILICGVLIILMFLLGSYVFAKQNLFSEFAKNYRNYDNVIETKEVSSKDPIESLDTKVKNIIEVLNNYLPDSSKTLSLDNYVLTRNEINNNLDIEGYVYSNKKDYEIKFQTASQDLISISAINFDYSHINDNTTKEEVNTFINKIYKDLKLNPEYELSYLEKFNDGLWEANYQKKYDGIYNPYESVKIIFSPAQRKIAQLRVFNIPLNASKENNISKEKAIQIAKDSILKNIKDTINIEPELVITRPNNLLDLNRKEGSKVLSSDTLFKAWKIRTDNGLIIYIDSNTGEIIGGDQIK